MKYPIFLILFFAIVGFKPNTKEAVLACEQFNKLNTAIRDGKIPEKGARLQFKKILSQLNVLYLNTLANEQIVFPLEEGYGTKSIGGKNGEGYKPNGYNYFDGNKHKGHPAHDIFIRDKNQDCIDDNTKQRVSVCSVEDGIVIAVENTWEQGNLLRGGKYIWVYNPKTKSLFYYAHCQTILVKLGEYIRAGQLLAFVGRTGLNASQKRSPTHLHLMQLVLDNNMLPKAVNCYNLLCKAKPFKC